MHGRQCVLKDGEFTVGSLADLQLLAKLNDNFRSSRRARNHFEDRLFPPLDTLRDRDLALSRQ